MHRRTPRIPPAIPEAIQAIIQSCYNFDGRLRPNSKQVYDQLREAKKTLKAGYIMWQCNRLTRSQGKSKALKGPLKGLKMRLRAL